MRECFMLYFHSCLISFLNWIRVEHRVQEFQDGGAQGLCCWGLRITMSFQANLFVRISSVPKTSRCLHRVYRVVEAERSMETSASLEGKWCGVQLCSLGQVPKLCILRLDKTSPVPPPLLHLKVPELQVQQACFVWVEIGQERSRN